MNKAVAIIVAAGQGQRARTAIPKQFMPLNGIPMLNWSVQAFRQHRAINNIILVLPETDIETTKKQFLAQDVDIVPGGATRSDSVRAALNKASRYEPDYVLIHDAARPGLDSETIDLLLTALSSTPAAAPALPMADAVKRDTEQGLITVDRSKLYRIQTPQAFHFQTIYQAHMNDKADLVDDLEAVEQAGHAITLCPGKIELSKVTYPEDLILMEKLLFLNAAPRMGTGFDVHAFEDGDHVTLCGLKIPHNASLKGHSDADVAWHALTDAIYGALAEGDIGDHFPPSEEKWRGEPSETFLRHAAELARTKGYGISNADLTLICEAPKVKPHRDDMRKLTAEVLCVPVEAVSIKATTTEGLGFTGRREGIAAQASVVLVPSRSTHHV